MNIKEIHNNPVKQYDPVLLKELGLEKSDKNNTETNKAASTATSAWKKEILMDALDVLENNIQVDDNHPLSSGKNAPIEKFDEAEELLNLLENDNFNHNASKAQAHLTPEQVLYLFVND